MGTGNDFDSALTLQDRVRLKLNEYGTKYVPITIEALASELGVGRNYDVYQALSRLRRMGELEFEKDEHNRIIGIDVIKLEPSGRTYQRAAERAKSRIQIDSGESALQQMTALQEYLNKKLAILEMQEKAKQAGLDPEETVKFDPNPYAEEGILLLKLVGDAFTEIKDLKEKKKMLEFDLEAEKRNVGYLKAKKSERDRSDLIESVTPAI